jgi:hypothetical protein
MFAGQPDKFQLLQQVQQENHFALIQSEIILISMPAIAPPST